MKNELKVVIGVIAVLIVVLGIVTLAIPDSKTSETRIVTGSGVQEVTKSADPIKIGVSLPLSGDVASYGQGIIGAIELAVKDVNAKGGVNGRELTLVIEDDGCNPNNGATAMNKLVNVNDVDVVIGPLCSPAGGASLPIAQSSGTPTIFWGSAPKLPKIGDYVFRTYPSDAFQGKFAAEFIYNDLGKKKVAVISGQNDWSQGIRDVFTKRFIELGGEVVFDEVILDETKDFRSTITKMKAKNPEAVYLPVFPTAGVNSVKQMKELGIDVPIVGGDAFAGDEFVHSGFTDGVIYTLAKMDNPETLLTRVAEETGKGNNAFTVLGYDAVMIFTDIMKEVGTDQAAIRDALSELEYTDAMALPLISFDSNGDLASAVFDVKVVRDKQSVGYTG